MLICYGLCNIHVMDICMNAFILADYINTSTRVAIGAGCPWYIILSAKPFLPIFPIIDWNFLYIDVK